MYLLNLVFSTPSSTRSTTAKVVVALAVDADTLMSLRMRRHSGPDFYVYYIKAQQGKKSFFLEFIFFFVTLHGIALLTCSFYRLVEIRH